MLLSTWTSLLAGNALHLASTDDTSSKGLTERPRTAKLFSDNFSVVTRSDLVGESIAHSDMWSRDTSIKYAGQSSHRRMVQRQHLTEEFSDFDSREDMSDMKSISEFG